VQGWRQCMGGKRSWGPCVVDEAEQVAHDATVVEVAAAGIAAVEVVAVGTAALRLVVVGK